MFIELMQSINDARIYCIMSAYKVLIFIATKEPTAFDGPLQNYVKLHKNTS